MKNLLFLLLLYTLNLGSNIEPKVNYVYLSAQKPETGIIEIPIYSDIKSYDNKLSTIASEIDIISMDENPLLNDFHIYNIELCDKYIFLSGMNFIYQYDRNGTFIRTIGGSGNGPEE